MSNEPVPPVDGSDDEERIAWFHRDAADAHAALSQRTALVGDLVRALGLHACLALRLELERLARITCELSSLQFADLKETLP
jgi:hypothetical protein